jgi:hypothetical protein
VRNPAYWKKHKLVKFEEKIRRPWKRVFNLIFGSHPNLFVRLFVPTFHTEFDNMLSFPNGNRDETDSKIEKELEEKNLIDCV